MRLWSQLKTLFNIQEKPTEKTTEKQPKTRIEYLVRELIKELKMDDKDLSGCSEDVEHISIWMFDVGTKQECLIIDSPTNGWEYRFKKEEIQ